MMRLKYARRLSRFRKDEDGSATIEALIWLPFYLFFFGMLIDFTTIFLQNSKVQRIVQDGARQYVKSGFAGDPKNLETWVKTALTSVTPNATVTSTVNGSNQLVTTVAYPTTDTDLTGATAIFGGMTMTVRVVYLTES